MTTNAVLLLGRYFYLHPNYGVTGGSNDKTDMRTTIVNSSAGVSGIFSRFINLSVKFDITVHNNEAFAVAVTLIPVPSIMALTLTTNHTTRLVNVRGAKTVTLLPATLTGCLKKISLTVQCAKLEGLTASQYKAITSFWATSAAVGGLYQMVYLQAAAINGSSTFNTATGLDFSVNQTYICEGFNGNIFQTV